MNLLVVRHAVAMDPVEYQQAAKLVTASLKAPDANDDFRPLTLDGIRKMKRNAQGLANLVRQPDHLVSSPLTRAQQTAEILKAVWDGIEIETCQCLRPDAKFPALVSWLNARVDHKNEDALIVIIGHEPHLSRLVSWFLKGSLAGLQQTAMIELKKGSACLLEFPEQIAKGRGLLKWLTTPAILKEMR